MPNYYKFTEEQKDDEVEGEIILKTHKLPELPQEILDTILYKFGGLQHPIAKMLNHTKKRWDGEEHGSRLVIGYWDKKFYDQMHWDDGFLKGRWETYIDMEKYIERCYYAEQWKKIPYDESSMNPMVYKWKTMNSKKIKKYLDENQIEYKKSWKKSKLIQTALSF